MVLIKNILCDNHPEGDDYEMVSNSKIDYDVFIKSYRESGLTLKQFCEKNDVSISAMNYHLYTKSNKNKKACDLVKIDFPVHNKCPNICLIHFHNFDIELNEDNIDLVFAFTRKFYHV